MRSTSFIRATRVAFALAAVATTVSVAPAAARPKPGVKRSGLNLFAGTFALLQVNHQYCPVLNIGNVCTDPSGNGVIEGGFWPKGTPDSYIFNSGLQIAGNIPLSAGFAWAGDTVGAFFMDPRGDQTDGSPVTNVFSSLDPDDQANWPNPEGTITDTAIYASVLQGLHSVSQQDVWFRAWDGNPTREGGRVHPMGVLVETRGMAWNYPTGNEDIMYFVYTFTNVTSSDANDYNNPTIPNTSLGYRNDLAALGAQFQQLNGAQFGVSIPVHGFEFDSVFAAFFMDCDVGTAAGANYSTVVVPFNMSGCYEASFNDPTWTAAGSFTPDIFGPPFAAAPGMVGVKYLRSPTDSTGQQLGLRMFGNTLNSGTGYPDPVGIKQMLRYISGFSSPARGDNPCTNQGQQLQLKYCYLAQTIADTRFFQSSGPFTLKPGEAKTIVVAYANAAPVNTPFLQTQLGGDFKPGFPATGDSIFKNGAAVRQIERVFGWVSQADANGNSTIEQDEVKTVPRSLLNKGLVAQAVFNAKFLLPFAPEPPQFFLIPGDNQVTVVWQKSPTETIGDPYYAVASQPIVPCPPPAVGSCPNALYDPDFRQLDVEGYRIYRGRTSGAMQVVAQFDYAGTQMIDYTSEFVDAKLPGCAPELGQYKKFPAGPCPITFDTVVTPTSPGFAVPLVGDVVQIPVGGRVLLADGSTVLITRADTAVTGGGTTFPALTDNGVTFVFQDRGVRNLFQYFYAVTAFDLNSLKSTPSSLESARVAKSVTPRAQGSFSASAGGLSPLQVVGTNGQPLNLGASMPTLDATTGIFSGPAPPTNALDLGFVVFLPQLVDTGTMTLSIDSIVPDTTRTPLADAPACGGPSQGAIYYLTGTGTPFKVPVTAEHCDQDEGPFSAQFPGAKVNRAKGVVFGGDSTFAMLAQASFSTSATWMTSGPGRGFANDDPTGASTSQGPRWWDGSANENTPDPNGGNCAPSFCGSGTPATGLTFAQVTALPNAGALTNVTALMNVQAYSTTGSNPMRDLEANTALLYRAADFSVFWGNSGTIDSIVDLTHHVQVPFKPNLRASWGILDTTSFRTVTSSRDGNNALINYSDIFCINPMPNLLAAGINTGCRVGGTAVLRDTAHLSPIAVQGASSGAGAQTGSGFILYLAGKFFMMQMTALPAAGTVWHARYLAGNILGTAGSYTFQPATWRAAAIPGLRAKISYTGSSPINLKATTDAQLSLVHTVPDPYYVTNSLEITPSNKVLKFVNLPGQAIIRIYSVSGVLVQVLTHNDPTGGGEQAWDLRNRSNQFVASGVYFYHVEAADGKTKIGRFTVVQFAP